MLQAVDYSVTLDPEESPVECDGYTTFKGIHEAADDNNHPVELRVASGNKQSLDYLQDLHAYSIEEQDLVTVGVTGLACPEISAERIEVTGKEQEPTEEACAQAKNLIIDVQTVRQKHPEEPVSSQVVAVGHGIVNTYLPKGVESVKDDGFPKNYQVCEEMNLCIPAMSEVNETVDPIKVKPAEGLPVKAFFEPATEANQPSNFPSGYVSVTGLLEFGEGGFFNSSGKAIAFSRLRLIVTDVVPLGISPNGKSEGKRQVQMLGQKKRVVRFGDKSEDSAPKQKRSLSSLKR